MTRKRKLCEMNGVEGRVVGEHHNPLQTAMIQDLVPLQKENEEGVDDPAYMAAQAHAVPQVAAQETTRPEKKKKKQVPRASIHDYMKRIVMQCEWNMCIMEFKKMEQFVVHVAEHLSAAHVTEHLSNGNVVKREDYFCSWRDCGFICSGKGELDRHVFFHAFHTKLKSVGLVMMKEKNYNCSLDPTGYNLVPEIPEPFQCGWDDCRIHFSSAQNFYWHVQSHIMCTDANEAKEFKFICLWEGCKVGFVSKAKLRDHVRSHTQEKQAGCPVCGSLYSNSTKLSDHFTQQNPGQNLSYKCSHCSRKFGSERLLRDHLRHHINLYKCSKCGMTTPSRSTLAAHYHFRHSDERPHKCLHCGSGFKKAFDLTRHMATHSREPAYLCPYDNCEFGSKAVTTLMRHVKKVHHGIKKPYLCHICDAKYNAGYHLSKHLMQVHNFHCPSGQSRFRYKQDEDGYYRLQTIRYESVELQETDNGQEENGSVDSDESLSTFPESPRTEYSDSLMQVSASVKQERKEQLDVRDRQEEGQNVLLEPPDTSKGLESQDIILPLEYHGKPEGCAL